MEISQVKPQIPQAPDETRTKGKEAKEAREARGAADEVSLKASLNAKIIQAQKEANITAGDKNLELIYRAAVDHLNEVLAPALGEEAIQNAAPDDYTPEAVADRIVSFATAFYGTFRAQNKDLSDEEAMNQFMEIIGNAIDKGFKEAKDILEGLKVLEGEVAGNIDKTYELIQEGLKAFRERFATEEEGATGNEQGAKAVE